MELITFPDSSHYDFAMQFVNSTNIAQLGLKTHPHTLEIESHNPIISQLLQRISNNQSVIFPFVSGTNHLWIITAASSYHLEQTVKRIRSFLVPTYASFNSEHNQPQFKLFNPDHNKLQKLGAILYPAGYYSLRAPSSQFNNILKQLTLWMSMEREQPDISSVHGVHPPTYHSLHERFQTALAATNWQEAEQILYDLKQLHLITADNKAFLEVQLKAQQQQWSDIWQRSDFSYLTRIRIPKLVRAALLTAFYTKILLPFEQQGTWDQAIEAFQRNRVQLGFLLTGRFGLTQTPVIHVFAYQAAIDKDVDMLKQLTNLAETPLTTACLNYLQEKVAKTLTQQTAPIQTPDNETKQLTPLYAARKALIEQNYDDALLHAANVEQASQKAVILMQIAVQSSDISLGEEALLTYFYLSEEERSGLEKESPFLRPYINYLDNLTKYTAIEQGISGPEIQPSYKIEAWLEWFDQHESTADQKALEKALDHLLYNQTYNDWQPRVIAQLSNRLMSFFFDNKNTTPHQQRNVLQYFVTNFLQDDKFPRNNTEYLEIYEVLYEGIREKQDVNQTNGLALLRLADALLQQAPQKCELIFEEIHQWCPKPIPAIESWVLEAFDLFAEYGLPPGMLASWYHDWLLALLNLPTDRERVNLQTWKQFGQWIQASPHILQLLEQALTRVIDEEDIDVIAKLPDGYRIGIMTLRDSSAQRVKRMLLERNKTLDIRICTEKDLNDQVKSTVQNSQMVVVVTTCITHALTYGIDPYIKGKPVYPRSSGSSSIMNAIEQRAKEEIKTTL